MENLFEKFSEFGPLYHSYKFFGVDNKQISHVYELNQRAKSSIITAYIALAISLAKDGNNKPLSFVELFCADAYYAMVASRLGCDHCFGVDNDREGHFQKAAAIAQLLGVNNISFALKDIEHDGSYGKADIVANIGGLYHVKNPEEVLLRSYDNAGSFLIIQNVVSLATDDNSYYESPAPGWSWGNRFSALSFDKMVQRNFKNIVASHFNELTGNDRPEDRGSLYYLIKKS